MPQTLCTLSCNNLPYTICIDYKRTVVVTTIIKCFHTFFQHRTLIGNGTLKVVYLRPCDGEQRCVPEILLSELTWHYLTSTVTTGIKVSSKTATNINQTTTRCLLRLLTRAYTSSLEVSTRIIVFLFTSFA
jgi:hypothetical protein